MKEISIEEQRKIQLDILSDIADFCEHKGLRYYLAYGTLIGAIRHHGYIPWDDDIDLWMLEPDYDKFLKEYQSYKYKLLHPGNTKNYRPVFAKVHDERTRFQEAYSIDNDYGIFVDIFPLHAYGNFFQIQRCCFALRLVRLKSSVWYKQKPLYKNIANLLGKILLFMIPIRCILNYIEKTARKYKYEDAVYLHTFMGNKRPYKKEWFNEYIYIPFEGHEFMAPKCYDSILNVQYGDYMQLPPEEERIAKHHAKVWRKE